LDLIGEDVGLDLVSEKRLKTVDTYRKIVASTDASDIEALIG